MNLSKEDILIALRKIDFLDRVDELAKKYRKMNPKPPIDKKKIFEMIKRYGYDSGYEYSEFYLKNQEIGNLRFEMQICLKSAIVDVYWNVYEDEQFVFGGPWLRFKRALLGTLDCNCPNASFTSYEKLDEIFSIVFKMYEDFKDAVVEAQKRNDE